MHVREKEAVVASLSLDPRGEKVVHLEVAKGLYNAVLHVAEGVVSGLKHFWFIRVLSAGTLHILFYWGVLFLSRHTHIILISLREF